MPELPEVETMVRGIRPIMEGAKIVEFRACPCERKPLSMLPLQEEFVNRVPIAPLCGAHDVCDGVIGFGRLNQSRRKYQGHG